MILGSAVSYLTITDSNFSLGSTGGFIIGSGAVVGTVTISNSAINLNDPNAGSDILRGTLILRNNNITINSASWNTVLSAANSLLYLYNNSIYSPGAGGSVINQTAGSLNLKNNIFYGITDVLSTSGGTANISNNDYYNSSDEGGTDKITSDPLLISAGTNFNIQPLSPAIDSGTASVLTSTTTDYLGHPLYGLPDIGAYEYQPPFTSGTSLVDPTGNIRIYGDRMYRYTTATSSTMSANFSVAPAETWTYAASTTRPEWLNISNITWNTSGTYSKQWTASSTLADSPSGVHATSTIYTIGDLLPSTAYTFKLDGLASTTAITGYGSTVCTNGVCTSNGSGVVSFTYTGGYSTHTFLLEDITPPTFTETTPISTPSTDTTPSYVFSSTEAGTLLYAGSCAPSSSTSISIGSNTVTFNALSDGTYINCKISVVDPAGNDSATTTLASFTIDNSGPAAFTTTAPISGATTSSKPTFSWNTASDNGFGPTKYTLYIDNTIDTDNVSSNTTSISSTNSFSCGSHSWYVKATDSNGNTTNSNTLTFGVGCSTGGGSAQSQVNNLMAMGFTTQANEVAKKYNISIPNNSVQTATINNAAPPINPASSQQTPSNSISQSFTRTLKLGMTGSDVKSLQQFLNTHGFIVSKSRAGSPNHETNYFGPATKAALIRFQNVYADQILKPQGLTQGTGVFGEGTRGYVNKLGL